MKRRDRTNKPRSLYMRATAIVVNSDGDVLLVKHNRQRDWSLPGGQLKGAEDPAHRARLEVAEETGLTIRDIEFAGRYAGSVAAHEIFLARAEGTPVPNHREIQETVWWDRKSRLDVQQHVSAILAIAGDRMWRKGLDSSEPVY